MTSVEQEIHKVFGNKLRLRISGICIEDDSILLIKHVSLGEKGILWAPPGGGLHFEESIEETLKREFEEETGLQIDIGRPLLINEYFEHPLHAVELFFEVTRKGGFLRLGVDPELTQENQIIQELRFVPFSEIATADPAVFHSLFKNCKKKEDFSHFIGFQQNIVFRA